MSSSSNEVEVTPLANPKGKKLFIFRIPKDIKLDSLNSLKISTNESTLVLKDQHQEFYLTKEESPTTILRPIVHNDTFGGATVGTQFSNFYALKSKLVPDDFSGNLQVIEAFISSLISHIY